jgi:Pentapeptide repeats (8 copies)
MLVREARPRPKSWRAHRDSIRHRWSLPFHAFEWLFQWTAYGLSRWAFLEVLEYIGSFSVLIGVIFYFSESGDRRKQKHYQAWQVINTAQGKGGSGGRIEALQELNMDRVPLVGVDAAGAFLQGVRLHGANLLRCTLDGADLRMSDFSGSNLEYASLRSANLRQANLSNTNFMDADLEDADLVGADLGGANLTGTNLANADLRKVDLKGVRWQKLRSIEGANIGGVRNAPEGFLDWAMTHKAVATGGE